MKYEFKELTRIEQLYERIAVISRKRIEAAGFMEDAIENNVRNLINIENEDYNMMNSPINDEYTEFFMECRRKLEKIINRYHFRIDLYTDVNWTAGDDVDAFVHIKIYQNSLDYIMKNSDYLLDETTLKCDIKLTEFTKEAVNKFYDEYAETIAELVKVEL